jgi:hypothetical protein
MMIIIHSLGSKKIIYIKNVISLRGKILILLNKVSKLKNGHYKVLL